MQIHLFKIHQYLENTRAILKTKETQWILILSKIKLIESQLQIILIKATLNYLTKVIKKNK